MEAYVALYIAIVLCIIYQEEGIKENLIGGKINVLAIYVFVVMVMFYGLRDGVGYDYDMYVGLIKNELWELYGAGKMEWLSSFFLYIATVFENEHIFFFLTALIGFGLYIYSLEEYSPFPESLSWGLLFFLILPIGFIQTLSIQRQFVAMMVLLFSMKYVIRRRFIKFLVCVCLASLFHSGSIIYLIVFFITSKRFKYRFFLASFFLCFAMSYGMASLMDEIGLYEQYINDEGSTGLTQFALYISIGVLLALVRNKMKKNEVFDIYLKTYLCGCSCMLLMTKFSFITGARLAGAMLLVSTYIVPGVFYVFREKDRAFVKLIFILVCGVIYLYSLSVTETGYYIPYKTFLEG